MSAGEEASAGAHVLQRLRTATAAQHAHVEATLDLLDPHLTVARLCAALGRLHGFWVATETRLDDWAARDRATATALDWPHRRRAHLFAADLESLGSTAVAVIPALPPVLGTDDALGRLYVLEGSSLGGRFIDRHLASLPAFAGARLRAFSPYGDDTGRMWHAFRAVVRRRAAEGGEPDRIVRSAVATFGALAAWCSEDATEDFPAELPA